MVFLGTFQGKWAYGAAWSGFAIAMVVWVGAAWSAPQTFNTALPVGEDEFVFREQFVLDQSGDDPSGANRDRTAMSAVSVLGYGVNRTLALFGVVPYVDKRPWSGFAIAMVVWVGAAWSAPQTFNTALPVGEDEFVFREQFVLDQSGDDPSGANRDRTAMSAVSVLGYGVNRTLALFGVVPYVDKRLELTENGSRRARSARGLGDINLFGRYTAFKKDWLGRTFRIAPFAGIEAPTGDDDERDAFGSLPKSVQLGSGSWDPFAGVVASYQTLDFEIDAQASYKANTEANDFEFGDIARLDASVQYRLWPRTLGSGIPGFLYGVLEANLIYQDENENGAIRKVGRHQPFWPVHGLQEGLAGQDLPYRAVRWR